MPGHVYSLPEAGADGFDPFARVTFERWRPPNEQAREQWKITGWLAYFFSATVALYLQQPYLDAYVHYRLLSGVT